MLLPWKRNQLINLLHQNFNSLSFFLFVYHLQPQGHTITTPSAVQILISQILCVMSLFLFSHDGAGVSVSISRNHMVIIVRHPPAVIGRQVLRWLWFDLRILWFVFIFLLTGGTNAHQLCIPNKELTKAKATKLTIFSQRAGFLFASSSPSKQLKPMTQKVVIKLTLEGHKSRSKALKIAVGVSGVESAALKGDDKSQIEVTGDGMDPVLLTSLLRKKVGYAELVSVGPAGEKKDENKPKNPEAKPQPPQYWPPYYGGLVPHYDYPVVYADRYPDPCSIM